MMLVGWYSAETILEFGDLTDYCLHNIFKIERVKYIFINGILNILML